MGKKNRRRTGQSAPKIGQRTTEERRHEAKKIVTSLTSFGLTTTYPAVQHLMSILSAYVQQGDRTAVNIPVPEIGRRITGVLATSKREAVWMKLEKLH
tara:strand:- start:368 stop:661 length:294 start_codon:yes stop_codon:yes gene_type:complete